MKRTVDIYKSTPLLFCYCLNLIVCFSFAAVTASGASKSERISLSPLTTKGSFDAKTLTVKAKGESKENAAVVVKKAGCACVKCAEGRLCPSGCCECNRPECVCCIVAKGNIENGSESFLLNPGKYEVILTTDDKVTAVKNVTITTKDKEVKFSTSDLRPEKN